MDMFDVVICFSLIALPILQVSWITQISVVMIFIHYDIYIYLDDSECSTDDNDDGDSAEAEARSQKSGHIHAAYRRQTAQGMSKQVLRKYPSSNMICECNHSIPIGHMDTGVILSVIENPNNPLLYSLNSNCDWLFSTQSKVLSADWLILENDKI